MQKGQLCMPFNRKCVNFVHIKQINAVYNVCTTKKSTTYIIIQKWDRIACENRIDFSELIHQSKQIFACNYRLYDNDEMTYYNEEEEEVDIS